MPEFILYSFYNAGTLFTPRWVVIGHRRPEDNSVLTDFPTRSQAIEYAHSVADRTPVIEGATVDALVELLTP